FHFFVGADPEDGERFPRLTAETLAAAPESALMVWDGHYGHEIAGGVELHRIERDPELQVVQRFLSEDRSFFAVGLRKISRPPAKPFQVTNGIYRHHGFRVHWPLPDRTRWEIEFVDDGTLLARGMLPSTRADHLDRGSTMEAAAGEQVDGPLSFEFGVTR